MIRKGIKIADIEPFASPLDIVKMMYDGDIPDDAVDVVSKYSDELGELNWYTIRGYKDFSLFGDLAQSFSAAATGMAFILGMIAARESEK